MKRLSVKAKRVLEAAGLTAVWIVPERVSETLISAQVHVYNGAEFIGWWEDWDGRSFNVHYDAGQSWTWSQEGAARVLVANQVGRLPVGH